MTDQNDQRPTLWRRAEVTVTVSFVPDADQVAISGGTVSHQDRKEGGVEGKMTNALESPSVQS